MVLRNKVFICRQKCSFIDNEVEHLGVLMIILVINIGCLFLKIKLSYN
jgi:hypothetical protein